jgi:hypothetical protein
VPNTLDELTALFRRLGASDPESWAKSQAREGINQLHRYLFLRQAWSYVLPDGDTQWIDHRIARADERPNEPYAGVGHCLKRLLAAGADRGDISELVRAMQAEMLGSICYLLDDPGLDDADLSHIGWVLVETDADFNPTDRPISGLHESVLETDPTGREMRPRPDRL